MKNYLENATSPYLKQHENNPVNWYPWGNEALAKAIERNKPIFLSIGYAACHWCHVMAHESFEDPEIAKILNDHFISIKVDREEHPDIDEIYMQSVVLMTGQGGWPLSVFLTPDLKPFYGGTYFPPAPTHGMPSFEQVLTAIINAWHNRRGDIEKSARQITDAIHSQYISEGSTRESTDLDQVVNLLSSHYDWNHGGWGSAPKFPQPMLIDFLIQRGLSGNQLALDMAQHALDHMARGGMYDLVSGGFHRYSTDNHWLIPHFEKMLYDNAQLALAYLHGFMLTGNKYYQCVVTQTLQFIQRELTGPEGGFYASLDADTDQVEGRFYAWEFDDLMQRLSSEELKLLQKTTKLKNSGNFEDGLNILQLSDSLNNLAQQLDHDPQTLFKNLNQIFQKLHEFRSNFQRPRTDRKIITEWNALAIRAFSQAGLMLGRKDYLEIARKAANFILNNNFSTPSHLHRSSFEGIHGPEGTLSDYAGLILALRDLYQVDFDPEIFEKMQALYQMIKDRFASEDALYFETASTVKNLVVRPKHTQDHPTPSGNALLGHVDWLFANYQSNSRAANHLTEILFTIRQKTQQYPESFAFWLILEDLTQHQDMQVAIVSQPNRNSSQPFLDIYHQKLRPYAIITSIDEASTPHKAIPEFAKGKPAIQGLTTAYVCHGSTCKKPTQNLDEFKLELEH